MAHGLEMRAPFLDHRFVGAVMALPHAARFTTPPRKLLAPAMSALGDLDPFARKKRGFNPPLDGWLDGDLAPRLPGLGTRLASESRGQLTLRHRCVRRCWRHGEKRYAEQVLQLVLLDESLGQLASLSTAAD